jgi:hypothetical protein
MRTVRHMNDNTTNRTSAHRRPPAPAQEHVPDLKTAFPDVDKAARALIYTLASALASNFDEARRLGCTDLLLVTTNVVARRVRS